MDAFRLYQLYQSVRLHFTSEKYDVFKSKGRVKVSIEAFAKRPECKLYKVWAWKCRDMKHFASLAAANFMYGNDLFVYHPEAPLAFDNYDTYRRRKEAITHIFTNDIMELTDRTPSGIWNAYMSHQITIETLNILDDIYNIFDNISNDVGNQLLQPEIIRAKKAKGFIKYNPQRIMKVLES